MYLYIIYLFFLHSRLFLYTHFRVYFFLQKSLFNLIYLTVFYEMKENKNCILMCFSFLHEICSTWIHFVCSFLCFHKIYNFTVSSREKTQNHILIQKSHFGLLTAQGALKIKINLELPNLLHYIVNMLSFLSLFFLYTEFFISV